MPFQEVYDSAEVTEAAEEAPSHRPYYGIKFEGSGDPRALKFVASKEEVDADQGASSIPRTIQSNLQHSHFQGSVYAQISPVTVTTVTQ